MRKTCTMLAILIFGALSLAFTQSRETTLALEEYKQIVAENRSYRTYGAESGLRGNALYQFTDAEGYRWYSANDGGYKIYRFDGIKVTDTISEDKAASQDTMLPILVQTKTTHKIYASGMHNLYLWQDYAWKNFAFPQQDVILRMLSYDDDVYCIGGKGIGLFIKGEWAYRPFKSKITEAEAIKANVSKSGNVYVVSQTPKLYIKKFSGQNTRILNIAFASKNPANGTQGSLKTSFDYHNGLIWIYEAEADVLLRYDLKTNRILKVSLATGTLIHSILCTDSGKNWLITNASGIVKATELSGAYPQVRVVEYSSAALSFRTDCLDFLYLEDQLLPYSSQELASQNKKYSLIRVLEANPQNHTFQIKELINPFAESICNHVYNYGKLLLMDLKHDKFQNVSHILIAKYPFERISTRDILIDSDTYQLAYNEPMDAILNQRAGKVSMIPLIIVCEEVFQAPSHGQQKNNITISSVKDYQLLSFKGIGQEANKLYLVTLKKGRIHKLAAVENASLGGIDEGAELVYLIIRGSGSNDGLYGYSLKEETQELIESLDLNARFFSFPGGFYIISGDQIKIQLTSGHSDSVGFSSFSKTFMATLEAEKVVNWTGKGYGLSLDTKMLDAISYTALNDNWLGATLSKVTIDNGDHSSTELSNIKIADLPATTQVTHAKLTTLNVPAHIYNVKASGVIFKPLWIRFYQQKNHQFLVGHLEKLPEDAYRYRISQFSDGKLSLNKDDFMLSPRSGYVPNVTAYLADGQQLFAEHNKLYYRYSKAWQTLDLSKFEIYGKLGNVTSMDSVLWLCYDSALLRYDPKTKVEYVYTSEEGIPDKLESAFVENGKLMLKTGDKIYGFNEYKNPMKLDIPYIIVSDSIKISVASKIILSYTQRHIQIPISILGPLYPELCQVSYRLRGYNEDWIIENNLGIIKYAKLPYGKYVFEIKATAANGIQTPVQSFSIRIKPPWYKAWYAIIVYILMGLGLAFLVYRWRLYKYREDNRQLELQVAERTHELQEWQLRMTQSIDYALLIQKSILPQEDQLRRLFKDFFLIWQPRDTVGGDFYWLNELADGNSLLFAVIDCTGHGVPGALVSMTVNAALNHIVKEHGVNNPEEILQELHQDIGLTLHQESERTQQDGLDISLVKIDYAAKTLSFAGAAIDIAVYDQDSQELVVLKGSKYSIGGLKHRKIHVFEPQQISFAANTNVYLFSDGILDQTSEINVRMKRLGPEQWYNTLREIGNKTLPQQKTMLEEMIKQMLLLDSQRDDITIVALQL